MKFPAIKQRPASEILGLGGPTGNTICKAGDARLTICERASDAISGHSPISTGPGSEPYVC